MNSDSITSNGTNSYPGPQCTEKYRSTNNRSLWSTSSQCIWIRIPYLYSTGLCTRTCNNLWKRSSQIFSLRSISNLFLHCWCKRILSPSTTWIFSKTHPTSTPTPFWISSEPLFRTNFRIRHIRQSFSRRQGLRQSVNNLLLRKRSH